MALGMYYFLLTTRENLVGCFGITIFTSNCILFVFLFIYLFFEMRVLLCGPGWPHDPPALAF
jgi:hypothetical protein